MLIIMRLSAFIALPGQSATEIATRCNVAVSTITRVAKGEKNPSLELMGKIRDATNGAVTPDDFLPPFDSRPASVTPVAAVAV